MSPRLADGIFADPERAGFFSNQHAANGEGIGVGIQIQGFQLPVLVTAQMSIRRVEPYRAGGIFTGRQQPPFMAGAPEVKTFDFSILHQRHTRRVRSDPKIRVTVFKQVNNPVTVQTRRVVLVENGEMISVKTHQAVERSEPEITIPGLNHGDDGVFRQPFLAGPNIHNERQTGLVRRARRRGENEGTNAKQQPCEFQLPMVLRHI